MKRYSGQIVLLLLVVLLFSFNSSFKKDVPIGTIVYSIMPPQYFEANNPEWVLLDGRKIESNSVLSEALLATTLRWDSLPDARGMFLRGANYLGGMDPDTTRNLGIPQRQATKLPNNSFVSDGWASDSLSSHVHDLEKRYSNGGLAGYRSGGNVWQRRDKDHKSVLTPKSGERNKHYFKTTEQKHGHFVMSTVNAGGDFETRPHNLNFYIYMKVK